MLASRGDSTETARVFDGGSSTSQNPAHQARLFIDCFSAICQLPTAPMFGPVAFWSTVQVWDILVLRCGRLRFSLLLECPCPIILDGPKTFRSSVQLWDRLVPRCLGHYLVSWLLVHPLTLLFRIALWWRSTHVLRCCRLRLLDFIWENPAWLLFMFLMRRSCTQCRRHSGGQLWRHHGQSTSRTSFQTCWDFSAQNGYKINPSVPLSEGRTQMAICLNSIAVRLPLSHQSHLDGSMLAKWLTHPSRQYSACKHGSWVPDQSKEVEDEVAASEELERQKPRNTKNKCNKLYHNYNPQNLATYNYSILATYEPVKMKQQKKRTRRRKINDTKKEKINEEKDTKKSLENVRKRMRVKNQKQKGDNKKQEEVKDWKVLGKIPRNNPRKRSERRGRQDEEQHQAVKG